MNNQEPSPGLQIAVGVLVAALIGVAAFAFIRIDPSGEKGNRLPEAFEYNLEKYAKIDPALIRFVEKSAFPVEMADVRAVAVGTNDQIFVAGDEAIAVFDADGKKLRTIELGQEPQSLAIGRVGRASPDRIFVGMRDHVEVYDGDGRRQSVWPQASERAMLTSIAVGEEDVFVADAGSLVVWRYDRKGKLLGQIGRRDPTQNIPGFVVPSPHFDVAIAPDGLLRVANPGKHEIAAFTFDGHLEFSWGKSGMSIESFCGCCNPSNFAILADGRFVTAEKGIPRVKIYSADGKFECVVVGTSVLAPNPALLTEGCDSNSLHPVDVAVDGRNRILVLDPLIACVRVFVGKPDAMK